ncbi:hypothetical protein CSC82_20460 [Rhodobacteraceae bacterium 4F10]|nr:hypothetical protein CSC82_20460 [Rhodobacteraceae bacterium 4F10]
MNPAEELKIRLNSVCAMFAVTATATKGRRIAHRMAMRKIGRLFSVAGQFVQKARGAEVSAPFLD